MARFIALTSISCGGKLGVTEAPRRIHPHHFASGVTDSFEPGDFVEGEITDFPDLVSLAFGGTAGKESAALAPVDINGQPLVPPMSEFDQQTAGVVVRQKWIIKAVEGFRTAEQERRNAEFMRQRLQEQEESRRAEVAANKHTVGSRLWASLKSTLTTDATEINTALGKIAFRTKEETDKSFTVCRGAQTVRCAYDPKAAVLSVGSTQYEVDRKLGETSLEFTRRDRSDPEGTAFFVTVLSQGIITSLL